MIRGLKHWLGDTMYSGTSIWDAEWDVCCILDGCRADIFQDVYPDAGEAISVASSSKRWTQRTFKERDTSSVGLITANPFAEMLDPDEFALLERVPIQTVDVLLETVPPKTLRDRSIHTWRRRHEHGIERLVVHFMQPHVPFRARPEWFSDYRDTDVWGHARWSDVGGLIRHDEWMEAYRDNLDWVIEDAIVDLRFNVDGEILVTADHGNAAGEWGTYGHPSGSLCPAVRRVPWYTMAATDLQEIHPDVESTGVWNPDAQLEALGYTGGEV